ncbi:hypothetical protein C4565_04235 [Candidatus Parcubacteria bacterium]|jgi:hypothetical protein|nr:MAG: hypothetical protein C4565_04235 [Candidatus Parcubacteria bacterium]
MYYISVISQLRKDKNMGNKNTEIRERLISKDVVTQKAFEILNVPYDGKETFHLGMFPLSDEAVDTLENAGFCYESAFNKSEYFIWHTKGEEWKVPQDKVFSINVKLSFTAFGILLIPYIDGYEHAEQSPELARVIFLDNIQNNSDSYSKAVVDGIRSKDSIAPLLLYAMLVRNIISLKELFYGHFANGSEIILNLASSCISPFRGLLDPTQDGSDVLFVSPDDQKKILDVWKNNFGLFYEQIKMFNALI